MSSGCNIIFLFIGILYTINNITSSAGAGAGAKAAAKQRLHKINLNGDERQRTDIEKKKEEKSSDLLTAVDTTRPNTNGGSSGTDRYRKERRRITR
mmetsp:Transcript_8962/g.10274  ORF Transcript_8962/g.10274 Transcript_8962/m.10274 type:complete len:96 (-) Transcript_8962:105-392(-)